MHTSPSTTGLSLDLRWFLMLVGFLVLVLLGSLTPGLCLFSLWTDLPPPPPPRSRRRPRRRSTTTGSYLQPTRPTTSSSCLLLPHSLLS